MNRLTKSPFLFIESEFLIKNVPTLNLKNYE